MQEMLHETKGKNSAILIQFSSCNCIERYIEDTQFEQWDASANLNRSTRRVRIQRRSLNTPYIGNFFPTFMILQFQTEFAVI